MTREQVTEALKKENIRLTPQRQYIIEELIGDKTHPTVADIYKRVHAKYPNISRSTVYQTCSLLTQQGLLREFKVDELSHYDPSLFPHSHGICGKCGAIIDLPCDTLPMEIIHFEDFTAVSSEVIYKGFCNICKEK